MRGVVLTWILLGWGVEGADALACCLGVVPFGGWTPPRFRGVHLRQRTDRNLPALFFDLFRLPCPSGTEGAFTPARPRGRLRRVIDRRRRCASVRWQAARAVSRTA